jgi:hypothetical protein
VVKTPKEDAVNRRCIDLFVAEPLYTRRPLCISPVTHGRRTDQLHTHLLAALLVSLSVQSPSSPSPPESAMSKLSPDEETAILDQFRRILRSEGILHDGDTIGTDDATLL